MRTSSSSLLVVQSVALAASKVAQLRYQQEERQQRRLHRRSNPRVRRSTGAHQRTRNQVKHIHQQLGPNLFKQAYRMTYHSFKRLLRKLRHGIIQTLVASKRRRRNNDNSHKRYIPNGPITPSVCLACALCYFAGGSPYDIMTSYCIGYTDMMQSVWCVVDAINAHPDFQMLYPADHEQQYAIAESIQKKSGAGFACCAGAIDGILVWIHKPSEADCAKAGCNAGKFYCGRKHKFGLNCQAVCDSQGKFLEMSIQYPGLTSDCLAFEGMSLFTRLEGELLAPGLSLFGDNAYLNSMYMATPYSAVSGGSKDAYNFFTRSFASRLSVRLACSHVVGQFFAAPSLCECLSRRQ